MRGGSLECRSNTVLPIGGMPPFDQSSLQKLCSDIKMANFSFDDTPWDVISNSGKDLVSKLLVVDPDKRLTATEARNHPWFTDKNVDRFLLRGPALSLTRSRLKSYHHAADQHRCRLAAAIDALKLDIPIDKIID